MRVQLTKKLADVIDEIDVTNYQVGDFIELPERKARLLVAEGWAVAERRFAGAPRVLAFRRASDLGHLDRDENMSQAS